MADEPRTVFRPWGSFDVLDEGPGYKVKRLEVRAGNRLSYQKHSSRSEHWTVVIGSALVTLDDREVLLEPGQSIDIGLGARHRVENRGTGPLILIEVQRGDYLGEDDIVRLEDDYGRSSGTTGSGSDPLSGDRE